MCSTKDIVLTLLTLQRKHYFAILNSHTPLYSLFYQFDKECHSQSEENKEQSSRFKHGLKAFEGSMKGWKECCLKLIKT